MVEQIEKLDFDEDLCYYTRSRGFYIIYDTLTEIPKVLIKLILDYASVYEPEGGCHFPAFLDSRHDDLIKEILHSSTRITFVTAPRKIGLTHMSIKMGMMHHIECKEQHGILSPLCFVVPTNKIRIWNHSRFCLARENFPWMNEDDIYLSQFVIDPSDFQPSFCVKFIIVDNVDLLSQAIIMKIFSVNSSRLVFMGMAWEEAPQWIKNLQEVFQFIQITCDPLTGTTSRTTRYVTGKELQ